MALPIQVNPKDPFIDIHTGRGQGSCTFANGFGCICSCAGIAHAQLLRMVLTPENSKKLPDKYKQALANKVRTVQARIADIPHDKVTTIIHAQQQPERVLFLCEDVTHPIIDHCRVIDILRWAEEDPLASQQVSELCTCVQNHGINSFKDLAPKAGEYLSQAHVLCDIVASIALVLSKAIDTIPAADTFINACEATFTLSRRSSLGFGPSRSRHGKDAIKARKSRQENDAVESKKQYADGNSISKDLLIKTLADISKDVYDLLAKHESQPRQFLKAVQATAILFCPDPDRHKLTWNMCFIPLFQTEICDDLRGKLNQDIITALEYGKEDIWDNGAAARW
ncbi:hypothetical protein G1C98_1140 [Bifidobacterium sp. DSM 109960]|uniref:Uncharacterized protein n=1 Tax=Bifidobacterium erythrocebi TaxID=2675325 RepID=A0A7Y0EU01_9BIFI|nr:hypothetical protein [Bifidobacterium sp. DSM 109960]NMM96404.1 hypothetical protein [Bifidobacterium sp. DSM 109960]